MIRQNSNCFGLPRFALLQTTLCKYSSKTGDSKISGIKISINNSRFNSCYFIFYCPHPHFIKRHRHNITSRFVRYGEYIIIPPSTLYILGIVQALLFSIFSNLPNNSFTSISLSFHRIVASLRCRCKGVYKVFTDEQGRALRFCEKSSLRPAVTRYLFSKTLYVLTSTPKSP